MKGKAVGHYLDLLGRIDTLRRERALRRIVRDRSGAQAARRTRIDASLQAEQSAATTAGLVSEAFDGVVGHSTCRADIEHAMRCAAQIRVEHERQIDALLQACAVDRVAQQRLDESRAAFQALQHRQEGLVVLQSKMERAIAEDDEIPEDEQ